MPKASTQNMSGRSGEIFSVLNAAQTIDAMSVSTFKLHPLKGDLRGYWAVTVRASALIDRTESSDR